MSNEAMNWAFAQPVSKSSAKFVLVAMANLAGADGLCWPSGKHLTKATCQDIKTVESGLKRLREAGYITDTGERRGVTGQVIVYRLNTPEFGGLKPLPSPPVSADNTSENGGVSNPKNTPVFPEKTTESGGVAEIGKTPVFPGNTPVFPEKTTESGGVAEIGKTPVFPGNTPVFPEKDPQISHETPPKTGDGTTNEPSMNPKGTNKKSACALVVPDVPSDVLSDFLAIRKAKHAPLTETALKGLRREAEKAGKTLAEVLAICCERGWQGFKAEWLADKPSHRNPTAPRAPSRHSGFNQLDYNKGVRDDGTFD